MIEKFANPDSADTREVLGIERRRASKSGYETRCFLNGVGDC